MTNAVEITQNLIRFPTINPPSEEEAAQTYLQTLLEGAGFSVERIYGEPERPNLITRLKGRGERAPLLFYGHTDVVGVEGQTWQIPPFAGQEQQGMLHGRGTLDMKAGVAMLVSSLLRAKANGVIPAGDIVLALVVDEEAGGAVGMQHLLEHHPHHFEGIHHAIGEFGGFPLHVFGQKFYRIGVAQKQYARIRLRLRGQGGHGSLPTKQTVMGLLGRVLQRLDQHKMPYHLTPIVEKLIREMAKHVTTETAQILTGLLTADTFDTALQRLPAKHEVFESLFRDTANPTIVTAGQKFNVIPAEASIDVDTRILPGHTPDDIVGEIRQLIGDDTEIDDIEIEVVASGPAAKATFDDTLFPWLADLLVEYDSEAVPIPYLFNESPDARLLDDVGIQNYGFLPMNLPPEIDLPMLIHGADERVPTSAIRFGEEVLSTLIERY